MNYTYEIQIKKINKHDYSQFIVKESGNNETPSLWSLSSLLNWKEISMDSYFKDSFMRTKEWLKNNYPEVSMKFLIFGDGIYDKNDHETIFWKFSELNNIPIKETDWKISSFKRTKTWLIENYPELLI